MSQLIGKCDNMSIVLFIVYNLLLWNYIIMYVTYAFQVQVLDTITNKPLVSALRILLLLTLPLDYITLIPILDMNAVIT